MRFAHHAIFIFVYALLLMLPSPHALHAQSQQCWAHWETLGGPYQDLHRSLELANATADHHETVYRGGESLLRGCENLVADSVRMNAAARSDLEILLPPVAMLMDFNSGYPRPRQDGLRWSGRGISAAAMAAAGMRWKWFSMMLAPVITYQQNDSVRTDSVITPGSSRFAHYYHANEIDLPQRFGEEPFWWYSLGQSFARVDAYGAAIGVSTENLRWGPARRNPLLMSGVAPGFPHVFVGTSDPVDVRVGTVELEAMWGTLSESDYFDLPTGNDSRLFGGLVFSFSPANTGLTLGFARSYLRYTPPDFSLLDRILSPYTHISVNEADNELISMFMQWVIPEAGFEVYGEYARDDAWEGSRDLKLEIDHSRAYTVGLEKIFARADSAGMIRIAAEATNLGRSPTWQSGRGGVTFYTHTGISQGYTHRGQLLGAAIGPGSDAQYVAADYLGKSFLAGIYVERARYDNDIYYDLYAERYTYAGHDAEFTIGVRGGGVIRGVQVIGEIARSSRDNRSFLGLNDGTGFTHESNVSVSVGAAWTPRVGRTSR